MGKNGRSLTSIEQSRKYLLKYWNDHKGDYSYRLDRYHRMVARYLYKRDLVLEHYGKSECSCCGEQSKMLLTIDHIAPKKGDIYRSGNGLVEWLVKNDLPPGFQILCYNCNCAKGFGYECEHHLCYAHHSRHGGELVPFVVREEQIESRV